MKLLMHTCCAPCSIMCINTLRQEGIEPTLYWYNPNIHPFTEYESRKNTLIDYSKAINAKLYIEEEYGLRRFTEEVFADLENRCGKCYKMRLEKTAEFAALNGYDAITTTLFVSPYQNHDLIAKIGQDICQNYGIDFKRYDFSPYFREGQQVARQSDMYMQKYCGCIFSEEERFLSKINKNESKWI